VAASLGAVMNRPKPNTATASVVLLSNFAMILLLHDANKFGPVTLKTFKG
jgi:hypothetical protein